MAVTPPTLRGEGALLASCGWRPGVLLNVPQCTGWPPNASGALGNPAQGRPVPPRFQIRMTKPDDVTSRGAPRLREI